MLARVSRTWTTCIGTMRVESILSANFGLVDSLSILKTNWTGQRGQIRPHLRAFLTKVAMYSRASPRKGWMVFGYHMEVRLVSLSRPTSFKACGTENLVGGPSICPGRFLAKNVVFFFCALLITEFHIEPLNHDSFQLDPLRYGLGTARVKNPVPVRIRRRIDEEIIKCSRKDVPES